jgi:hypothetical protein
MSFTPTIATLATAGTLTARPLPMPDWSYGVIAFASFLVLLGVLWSFRNTAAKYDKPITARHDDVGGWQGSRPTIDPGAHH